VAQQPPEPLGAAHAAVGDDEEAVTDAGAAGRACEVVVGRQRVAAALAGRRREVGIDVEEARARDVTPAVELAATSGIAELPAAVDEPVPQGYQLPAGAAGSGTEAGWIT
jgi:hypothetical protein